ncbi:MAG: IS110 family transposase [Kocuria sp.]|nr:IS110 family transposase [Kocuria sp.]
MDLVHERAAGIDISKRDAKVAIRVPGKRAGAFTTSVTTWAATSNQILALRQMLIDERVTTVVMEATSDYWKPFFYLFEDVLPVMLVNAKAAKNIPGRKTDVSDASWLAQLGAHGLLRACFVPAEPIRELRDLTRARTIAAQDRTRETQRLEKFLESTGIKLSASVSDLMGASSRAMLDALITGERDPDRLAEPAKGAMRNRIPELVEALTGRFTEHHAFICRMHLDRIDSITEWVEQLTNRIEEAMEPFRVARDYLITIPGVSVKVADVIVAETGADMSRFESPGRLASWAGVCPGSNESAGRVKSTRTRPGNQYLKGALGLAALSIARHPSGTYLGVRHKRIIARRGKLKAVVATEHSILTAVWHMLANGVIYDDPGADFFAARGNPDREKTNALNRLRSLGYQVTLTPVEAA